MKGQYSKAILNCNEAIKLQPKSVRGYLYRYSWMPRISPALDWKDMVQKLHFTSYCRGALKYRIKAYELAIKDLTTATTINSQCAAAYFNRAVCYHECGKHTKVQKSAGRITCY